MSPTVRQPPRPNDEPDPFEDWGSVPFDWDGDDDIPVNIYGETEEEPE